MRPASASGDSHRARARLPWIVTLILGVVAATSALDSAPHDPRRAGPTQAVRAFAHALEVGAVDSPAWLLHDEVDHRDLATGAMIHGLRDWEVFFRETHPPTGRGAGSAAEVLSSRLLTPNVAIANLGLRQREKPRHGSSWPQYTAVLLVYDGGRWSVAATRAGGNYATMGQAE